MSVVGNTRTRQQVYCALMSQFAGSRLLFRVRNILYKSWCLGVYGVELNQ